MDYTKKLGEKVIEHRLRLETSISEKQFVFISRRSTIEANYVL